MILLLLLNQYYLLVSPSLMPDGRLKTDLGTDL